jgi:hypothetical protein
MMCFARFVVDVVDHRGERGRLAGAGGAGDDDEPLVEVAEFLQRLGQLQGPRTKGSSPGSGGRRRPAPVVVEEIAAEAGDAGDLVRQVEVLALQKIRQRFSGRFP